jgi:hypothetical protein
MIYTITLENGELKKRVYIQKEILIKSPSDRPENHACTFQLGKKVENQNLRVIISWYNF